MGRGRQKAKQTKVARRLKYYSEEPDLAALQRELSGEPRSQNAGSSDKYEEDDPYAHYYDPEEDR
ncbi:MAG: DUF3073 domain-containing protein [Actinomycetaceae bacterium]|nr:DUF3073 domain-containing protein [Actinomycetaceae bacterium]